MAVYSSQHFCGVDEYHVSVRYHEESFLLDIMTLGRDRTGHVTFSGSPAMIKELIGLINKAGKEVNDHDA